LIGVVDQIQSVSTARMMAGFAEAGRRPRGADCRKLNDANAALLSRSDNLHHRQEFAEGSQSASKIERPECALN
jgi:hypothetical protein